ncbi:metallophosphoesterase family protein [Neobacillus sp. PS3-34]|uniref:metallophosphoesterase family protein n=1 Tax=Neobacillus sp. PS3-34 TaxID=3070678 RepID=UPI0027DEE933|nr:metallophosphoesterase family protein [Neobacillus sp. PS3-34]WML47825.1 metallophosphoesterase family protein [Neobacillus sp. PS3-34]
MRLAFISDIHGNAVALEAVLEDIRNKKIDKIFVLGDLCFRGPEPKKCLELVQRLDSKIIKGNADEWIIRGIKKGEVVDSAFEIMSMEREWTLSKLDKVDVEFLTNLPVELNLSYETVKIHAFHATPSSLFDIVKPTDPDENIIEKMILDDADIIIYGHIHKPYVRFINGSCVLNVGSVGLPFDGVAKSSYAIIDLQGNSINTSIVRVNYDVDKVVQQFIDSDYPNLKQMATILKNGSV